MLFALGALLCLHVNASAAIITAFEFNTAGDAEGWTHNGANGGGSGAKQATAAGGEGVLTSVALPGNGDLRVLYNPDISLPAGFANWTTIELRFRQLDGLDGNPQALAGDLALLHFGIEPGSSFDSDGTIFTEESAGDPEFWYSASLDISGHGAADIAQIRIDPLASTTLDYQIDWVRVNGARVPEPSATLLAMLGLAATAYRRLYFRAA
ncbi:MAG: hypothetical protein CMJ58_18650 [Planctomycetaceae bacterium]|nr:hypothetical protein [Planctomycetaceae bacterium]